MPTFLSDGAFWGGLLCGGTLITATIWCLCTLEERGSRLTAGGRGRLDGRRLRVAHTCARVPLWEGEKLLARARDNAERDYDEHRWIRSKANPAYIEAFVQSYTRTDQEILVISTGEGIPRDGPWLESERPHGAL